MRRVKKKQFCSGSPAVFNKRPVVFRPRLTTGLALFRINLKLINICISFFRYMSNKILQQASIDAGKKRRCSTPIYSASFSEPRFSCKSRQSPVIPVQTDLLSALFQK